jgi:integrase
VNKRHLRTLEARLTHLEAAFGDLKLAHLIPAHVDTYKAERLAAGASNGTVNRELEVLARAFTLGRKQRLLNATGEFVREHRLEEAPAKAGFFEREQYEMVRRELGAVTNPKRARPDLVLAVTLYHEYGWRVQEVLGLELHHINLAEGDHGTIRLSSETG